MKLEPLYQNFYDKVITKIPKNRVFTDALHTLAYGTDASLYRLNPKIVIKALSEDELSCCMATAYELKLPITFRTAGTSLSGQSSSDSILVSLNWGFRKFEILDNAEKIKLQPGLIASFVNTKLKSFDKKIGPDPASIESAMIGGIINNNSSGMCCGISENSYQTMDSMRIMLYDRTILDTGDNDSIVSFKTTHKFLLDELSDIKTSIKNNKPLNDKIIQKYKIKNTTGYSLNAFTDYSDPIDILSHIIIGSEGTLAILLDVVLKTVTEHPQKASAMVYYKDVYDACKATEIMKTNLMKYVFAAELFDRAAIKSVEHKEIAPKIMKTLGSKACAILIETRGFDIDELNNNIKIITDKIKTIESLEPIEFFDDEAIYSTYWTLRKGLIPSLGELRETGSTVIIEDVAFPIEHLAKATIDMQEIFKKYNYKDIIIMGHALEGNLHLVFSQTFNTKEDIDIYDKLMQEICDKTINLYEGSLKAEHGTGRNVAPFVEAEWGNEAFLLMKRVKKVFDPHNILNPNVLLSDDKQLHIKNLKKIPATHPLVDKCIECGFCESECPSRDLSLTPRQRIVINREISELERTQGDNKRLKELKKVYEYDGDNTCATCSMCAPACPVSIDTGKLTKYLREKNNSDFSKKVASFVANNFSFFIKSTSFMLLSKETLEKVIGQNIFKTSARWFNKKFHTPIIQDNFPKRAPFKENKTNTSKNKVVYFPSCISRTMSSPNEEKPLFEVIAKVLEKANYEIIYPNNISNLCCGMPFSSKGFNEPANAKYEELKNELIKVSENGKYPILIDTAPCSSIMNGIHSQDTDNKLHTYEPIDFIKKFLLDKLDIKKSNKKIAIHTTCSSSKMGLNNDFIEVANKLSNNVLVPSQISCCGFAGDRGFNYPELNQSALNSLESQVSECDKGYCTSLTCEIGLSEYSKMNYSSIFYLLDEYT